MRFPTPTAPKATARVLVVMALALGQWLHEHLPEPQDSARPFEVAVTASDTAVIRSGDLDVVSVDGATSVLPARGHGDPMMSPGLFVVVDFTFTPRDESSAITYAALRDNLGRVLPFFTSSVRSVVSCPARLVGRPTQCLAVVEADDAAAEHDRDDGQPGEWHEHDRPGAVDHPADPVGHGGQRRTDRSEHVEQRGPLVLHPVHERAVGDPVPGAPLAAGERDAERDNPERLDVGRREGRGSAARGQVEPVEREPRSELPKISSYVAALTEARTSSLR